MPQSTKFNKPYNRPKAEDVFTDRERPLATFEESRNAIRSDLPKLLTFYGMGGLGKSALCDKLIRHLKSEKPRRAAFGLLRINQDNSDRPHEALLDLRLSIGEQSGLKFHAFDIAFALYWKQAYPEQNLQRYRDGRFGRAMDDLSGINDAVANSINNSIPGFILIARIGRLIKDKIHKKWVERTCLMMRDLYEKDKLISPDQISDRLPYFLAADLKRYMENNPKNQVILFIDEYEQLWSREALKAGEKRNLVDEAIKELVANSPGVMFVLFSREELHWDKDDSGWVEDLKGAQHLLGGLSPKDADEFLVKCNVTEEKLRKAIIQGAGGDEQDGCHPEFLDILVEYYYALKFEKKSNPKSEDFRSDSVGVKDRRHQLFHRFLRGCTDRTLRDTLRYLAITETFDRQLFEELVQRKTGYPFSGFTHLISYSFMQSDQEGRYRLHPRMCEVLNEDFKTREPDDYRAINDFFFQYYDKRCRPDTIASISPDHEVALSNAARHLLTLDEMRFPDWLSEIDTVFFDGARFQLLQPLYERALEIREKTLGPDHPDFAESLNSLAMLYWKQCKYEDASVLLKRALKIREKALGPDHPDFAESLNNLAILYWKQGKYDIAVLLQKRALKIREKALGPDHPDVAESLSSLAFLYSKQGKYDIAVPLQKRALKIREKTLGPDHPDFAESLNGLATLYYKLGNYDTSLPIYQQSLEIREKVLGPNHPAVALSLDGLAILYDDLGNHAVALTFNRRALEIREKVLGPNHPAVAWSLNDLATLYYGQGKYKAAIPLQKRALAIREKSLGPDHPDVGMSLNNMALLYGKQGKHEKAIPLFERALAIRDKILGSDHPDTITTRENLSKLRHKISKMKK